MGDGADSTGLVPRLCHIVRWSDFNGYGFNLHAEKGKAGQFIGKVDDGSPAEAAGLKPGDRIVEVNGTNVGNENHQQVVGRIKAGGDETRLLVVDSETDAHYKDEKKVVRGDLPEVRFISSARDEPQENETPEVEQPVVAEVEPAVQTAITDDTNGTEPEALPDESSQYKPRLCHLCKWPDFDGYGFNLHAEKEKPGQYIGSVDPDSPAETGGLRDGDRIIEVNGENIESEAHSTVIQKIKAGGDKTSMLVVDKATDDYYKSRNITVSSSMPHVVVTSTPERSGDMSNTYEAVAAGAYDWDTSPIQDPTLQTVDVDNTEADVSAVPEPNVSLSDEEEIATAEVAEKVESSPPPDEPESVQNGTEEAAVAAVDDMAPAMASVSVEDEAAAADEGAEQVDYNQYEEVEFPAATQSNEELEKTEEGIESEEGEKAEFKVEKAVEDEAEAGTDAEQDMKETKINSEVNVEADADETQSKQTDEVIITEKPEESEETVAKVKTNIEPGASLSEHQILVDEADKAESKMEERNTYAGSATEDVSQGTASNGINGGSVVNSAPEPEPAVVSKPAEPEPAVINSTSTESAANPDLNLNLSAAEMKERLRSRKKQDPRLQKTSFEAKYKMFEKM